jgi:hypothetical protein
MDTVPIRPSLLLLLASSELVGLASVAYLDQERLGIGGGS